jgi:hypothetical protein
MRLDGTYSTEFDLGQSISINKLLNDKFTTCSDKFTVCEHGVSNSYLGAMTFRYVL